MADAQRRGFGLFWTAKRSQHTIGAYRDDLLGVAARIACQPDGPTRPCSTWRSARTMRQAFAAWASDHAAASMVRLFEYLIDDEVLDRNPIKAVPKPKLAVMARAIRQENVAETLLAAAGTGPERARLPRPHSHTRIHAAWPWADALVAAFIRARALPAPA
jgi:site-specific recombinase XerD